MVTELLQKYIWLVQTLMRTGDNGLDFKDLSSRWYNRFGTDYSRRTFNNHREAVEDVFGIKIECNRSTNCYLIKNVKNLTDENAESAWLVNTFTVNNILSLKKSELTNRVSVEDIPSGHLYLTPIMDAMLDNAKIKIVYQKYTAAKGEELTLHPYAVKEFAKRWYLIAYCEERNGIRVYGLDRIKGLSQMTQTFKMPLNFDVDELFASSFGIYLPSSEPCTIKFKVPETEARFLRDLPLHKSQEELESNDGYVTFSIFVCPDKNLIMEFCKYGSHIEILSPTELREQIANELRSAAAIYN